MKNFLLPLIILCLLSACDKAVTEQSQTDKIEQVESSLVRPVYLADDSLWTIEERMAHYGVPGVSIAVIKDGKVAWAKSYGVIDKESQEPVTNETLFQAGSISKPVAAYGALAMVEQNKLNLDEGVNSYLTSWQLPENEFTKEKEVSLKHLLSHTGGLTVHGFLGYSPDLAVPTTIQVLNGERPANSDSIVVNKVPEESFRYSGGGYTVMQQMMVDVEGKAFPELMKDLVLQSLGMTNSTYDQPLKEAQLKKAATGYLPDGTMTKGKRHTYPEMAAAGLWTTAEDLARFAIDVQQTLKGKSNAVLSQDMGAKMLTPFVEDFIGLGIFLNKKKNEIYFGHGGWDEGFSAELTAHKDKGYGVVVLTNSNHPAFIQELIRAVALTYDWADFVPKYTPLTSEAADLEKVIGRYKINNGDLVQISSKSNRLFAQTLGGDQEELYKISDSTYLRRSDHQFVQFVANENGNLGLQVTNADNDEVQTLSERMSADEKLPFEYILDGDVDSALSGYQALMAADPKDPAISENYLNRLGYQLLNSSKIELAKDIFKVNMLLYPNSSNVYDSYAEACMKNGDIDLAIANYKKSFEMDPNNTNALNMIEQMESNK